MMPAGARAYMTVLEDELQRIREEIAHLEGKYSREEIGEQLAPDNGPQLDTFAGIDPARPSWDEGWPIPAPLPTAGVRYDPTEPTGAEKLAAALAARTEPGRVAEAVVYAPEAVDQAIADVRTQVELEAKKREEEGVTLDGGHRDLEVQRAGIQRRRQGRSKGIHGKPCPKCPRRNGPRSRVCACGYRYDPEQKKVGKPVVVARRRNRG